MAAKWNYPSIGNFRIDNAVDSNGYLITDINEGTAANNRQISVKGFATPEDDQDANSSSSTFKLFTEYVLGNVFGLNSGLNWNSASVQASATISGEFD